MNGPVLITIWWWCANWMKACIFQLISMNQSNVFMAKMVCRMHRRQRHDLLVILCSEGSPQQHPHLRSGGGVRNQDGPHEQGSRHQLAEEQADFWQRPQIQRSHVYPEVTVPPTLQGHQPSHHGRPWDRRRSLHGLHPGERLAQRPRFFHVFCRPRFG